ncbi:hypothetical protein CAOG_07988 [Capsaspora owczarzaki ATCC 30864]|uniref:G-protein coupled receptors family 3 profile domain-containing protein n=1 Tax=Capsaspora owczarzaki (strain ATCC 30864) TaxID=595528 RepID=A0A0D2X5J5_CAPO3|nr:hypothetical protein CAOG_07988 [Capsaspora owczarzaki ATCC 30864]KJE97919.1 hypothetical protein CAOG_007988 [Capsaspora owczarzaki ATCC 30864]|eukprot:XP_004342589.1 hypothetical protein CAOG_07988 [Capsaspora owczarzaki ATCC 30864]
MTNSTWLQTDITPNWNPLETWVVGVGLFLFVCQLGMALLLVVEREWKPFKAKQPVVLLVCVLSAILSFLGEMHAILLLPQEACYFWKQWALIALGLCLCASAHLYRFFTRWVVLKILTSQLISISKTFHRRAFQLAGALLIFLPVLVSSVAMGTVVEITIQPVVMANGELMNVCSSTHKTMLYTVNLAMGIYFCILGTWWTYTLRNVRAAFNEYRSARPGIFCSMLCLAGYFTARLLLDNAKFYNRALKLALNAGVSTPIFVAIAGGVVWDWLTRRDLAEKAFEAGMAMTMLSRAPLRGRSSLSQETQATSSRKSSVASSADSTRSAPLPEPTEYAVEVEDEDEVDLELELGLTPAAPSAVSTR